MSVTRVQSRELKKSKSEMLHTYLWIKMKDPNTVELPVEKTDQTEITHALHYQTKFSMQKDIMALMGESQTEVIIHEKTTMVDKGLFSEVSGEFGGAKFDCTIAYESEHSSTTVTATVTLSGSIDILAGLLDTVCSMWLNEYFDQLQNINIPGMDKSV